MVWAMLECGRTYGWRVSELKNLRAEQLDFAERVIRLEPGDDEEWRRPRGRNDRRRLHSLAGLCHRQGSVRLRFH